MLSIHKLKAAMAVPAQKTEEDRTPGLDIRKKAATWNKVVSAGKKEILSLEQARPDGNANGTDYSTSHERMRFDKLSQSTTVCGASNLL